MADFDEKVVVFGQAKLDKVDRAFQGRFGDRGVYYRVEYFLHKSSLQSARPCH